MFADDTQLQKSAEPKKFNQLVCDVQSCGESVKVWMTNNKLKMNQEKTDIIPVATEHKLKSISNQSNLLFCGSSISFSSSVRNLGVFLDSTLSMETHINRLRRTLFLELRRIGHIRPYLSLNATKKLVSAFVLSRMDYCNSLFAGLPDLKLDRLQRIQNNAARLVLGRRKHDHATPLLKSLHWLPIKARIEYKIALLCYNCLKSTGPSYLRDMLTLYQPSRSLRSADSGHLCIPRIKLNTYGKRSFAFVGPTTWNSLPKQLRDCSSVPAFKTALKTHLFRKHFPDAN